jgi:hypothetical protein
MLTMAEYAARPEKSQRPTVQTTDAQRISRKTKPVSVFGLASPPLSGFRTASRAIRKPENQKSMAASRLCFKSRGLWPVIAERITITEKAAVVRNRSGSQKKNPTGSQMAHTTKSISLRSASVARSEMLDRLINLPTV